MFDLDNASARRSLGTVTAILIVILMGLVLDLGHHGSVPRNFVKVGDLVPPQM